VAVDSDTSSTTTVQHGSYDAALLIVGFVLVGAVGFVASVAWVQVMVWCSRSLLRYTLLGVLGLGTLCAALFFSSGTLPGGVITLFVTIVALWYLKDLQKRVQFASAIIKVACRAIRDNIQMLGVSLGFLICQVAWSVVWGMAVLGVATNAGTRVIKADGQTYAASQCATYETAGPDVSFSGTCTSAGTCVKCVCEGRTVIDGSGCFSYKLYAGGLVTLLLAFVWCYTVLKNIVHCTVSGTVGKWWFLGKSELVPPEEALNWVAVIGRCSDIHTTWCTQGGRARRMWSPRCVSRSLYLSGPSAWGLYWSLLCAWPAKCFMPFTSTPGLAQWRRSSNVCWSWRIER
jgi:hypothetical protein